MRLCLTLWQKYIHWQRRRTEFWECLTLRNEKQHQDEEASTITNSILILEQCCNVTAVVELMAMSWLGNVVHIDVRECIDNCILMFFSTVHHSIELFHQPTLMHNFLYSLTICLLHYYLRHVSSINMLILRRKNCIHTASGIFALCKRLHSTLVETQRGSRGIALLFL